MTAEPVTHQVEKPELFNPVTGDALWFEQTPQGANGALAFRCRIPARSPGSPLHLHRVIDETFECLDGRLSMVQGRNERVLAPGQVISVPRGMVHRFWNASDEPVTFRGTVTPGLGMCRFLETLYGLGAAGLVGPQGMPRNPLEVAVIRELSDLFFPKVPLLIQRPIFACASSLARATGTRTRLSRFWIRGEGGES